MTIYFQEDWTGNNGDPWNSAKWTNEVLTGTSLRDIQLNAGRALAQNSSASTARVKIQANMSAVADFEFRGMFRANVTGEQYTNIMWRGGTEWSNVSLSDLSNCYQIEFANNAWVLRKVVAKTRTTLASGSQTLGTGFWSFFIRCEGTSIKVRWWQVTEPTTWQADVTDSAHASGIIALHAGTASNGIARPRTFDSFLVQSLYVPNTTNLQDSAANVPPQVLGDLDETDPTVPDANTWSPVSATLATVAHVGFPVPYSMLVGEQRFLAALYCTAGSPTTPAKGKLTLYQDGAAVSPEVSVEVDVTSTESQVVTLDWNASNVVGRSGIELRIDGTPGTTGGSPVNTVGVKAVQWLANDAGG